MGNPKRKSSLGRGMTGGGGALPYFNAFMRQFMKGKKRDFFPKAPPIPSEIKSMISRRKREQLERIEKLDAGRPKLGGKYTGSANTAVEDPTSTGNANTSTGDGTVTTGGKKTVKIGPSNKSGKAKPTPKTNPAARKTPAVVKPTPKKKGTKRKGKKGDG